MSATIIISYDGTPNDDDALALGKMLARGAGGLALAYVRHSREFDPHREELAQHDAERRLEHGAAQLAERSVARHVVVGAGTAQALSELAHKLGAALIVFGSDYRTPPGRVEPGHSAQQLLDGGTVAVGIASAGLRAKLGQQITTIAVPLAGPHNDAARQSARSLADALHASVVQASAQPVDLVVVGSKPGAPDGHVMIGGDVRSELDRARSSMLVLPAATPLKL